MGLPWLLRPYASIIEGMGLIPRQGTKTPVFCVAKKKKKKTDVNNGCFLSGRRKVFFLNVQNLLSTPSYFYNLFFTENTLRINPLHQGVCPVFWEPILTC